MGFSVKPMVALRNQRRTGGARVPIARGDCVPNPWGQCRPARGARGPAAGVLSGASLGPMWSSCRVLRRAHGAIAARNLAGAANDPKDG